MSHGPRNDHRIARVDFSEGYISCTCRWEQYITEEALGRHDGNAAVEAAWLAHRREMGEALRALLSSAGHTMAMARP